jgi:hypothetical protein
MRAFLPVGVKFAVSGANQNRRVIFVRVAKIERRTRLQARRAFDFHRRKLRHKSVIIHRFRGKARRAQKQRARSQEKKIAKLAARDLRFFVAVVGKFALVRRGGFAHVALVG